MILPYLAVQDDSATPGSGLVPIWGNEGIDSGKARQASKQSVIPTVKVEPPGCSYNPSFESHQDSLAQSVAEETRKVYKSELGPQPVHLTVVGEVIDEDGKYFIEADEGSDDEMNEENLIEEDPEAEKSHKGAAVVTQTLYHDGNGETNEASLEGPATFTQKELGFPIILMEVSEFLISYVLEKEEERIAL